MNTITVNLANGSFLCQAVIADTFKSRGIGLLGRKSLPEQEGLLIIPCTSVHTMFMKFAIDVLYLDKNDVVVKALEMRPSRMSFGGKGSHKVLEVTAGTIRRHGISRGDMLFLARSSEAVV